MDIYGFLLLQLNPNDNLSKWKSNNQSQRQKRGKDIQARTSCDVANTRHELHLMKLLVGMALAVCRLHYVSDISIKAGKRK